MTDIAFGRAGVMMGDEANGMDEVELERDFWWWRGCAIDLR